MSAMSASPPLGVPISLIAEHKVSGTKAPPGPAAVATPTSTSQQVPTIPAGTSPPAPSVTPIVASTPQPQTNGMEVVVAPLPPVAPPQVSSSPSPSSSLPPPVLNTVSNNAQGGESVEGSVCYAPGSGTCGTSGGNSEVEVNSAAVGDIPPVDAQPSVPPTPATIPTQPVPQPDLIPAQPEPAVPAAPVEASPAPAALPPPQPSSSPSKPTPASSSKSPSVPVCKSLPIPTPKPSSSKPVSSPTKPTPPSSSKASPSTPNKPSPTIPSTSPSATPSAPPASQSDVAKPARILKRKAQPTEGEASKKKAPKVEELTKMEVDEDGRKSKRSRLPTQPYQSPIPELNIIAKLNNTSKPSKKPSEEKLTVFYRNEFLAVRNAEGGFYVCQTMQNIYRPAPGHRSKIKIRWFSQGPNDVFTPDFYDSTEFDCILTNLNLDRLKKDKYKLPSVEKQRTESILKRAIDAEKGETADQALTEEHPDGLDLSLYRHEDQLKKKAKSKKEPSTKKIKAKSLAKPPVDANKPTRGSARNSTTSDVPVKEKSKSNEKVKSIPSKKKKGAKKIHAAKKKEVEVSNNKKDNLENASRKTANSGATQALPLRKTADKTKSAVGAKISKAPPGANKQLPAQRSSRTAKQ